MTHTQNERKNINKKKAQILLINERLVVIIVRFKACNVFVFFVSIGEEHMSGRGVDVRYNNWLK